MQIYGVRRGCVASLLTMHYHLLRNNINVLFCHLFFLFSSGLCLPVVTFFRRISDPEIGSGAVDVYAMMFACQFIIFIIIVFSWSAFSSPEVFPALSSPEVFRGPAFSVKRSLLLVVWHLTNHTNSLLRGCGEVARVKQTLAGKRKAFSPPIIFAVLAALVMCNLRLRPQCSACSREKKRSSSAMALLFNGNQIDGLAVIGGLHDGVISLPRPECFVKVLYSSHFSSLLGTKEQLIKFA